jgi:hypothetical protein
MTDDPTDDAGLALHPIDWPAGPVDVGALRATSDRLLELVDEVAAAEHRKRQIRAGSTDFLAAATDVAILARRVERWADRERELAARTIGAAATGELEPVAIESVEPRPADRILAEWWDAVIRFGLAPRDSPERAQAAVECTQLRQQYSRMVQDRRDRRAEERHDGAEERDG